MFDIKLHLLSCHIDSLSNRTVWLVISYMPEVLATLLSSQNSKVISEAKYDNIVAHLSQPHAATDTADPKLSGGSGIREFVMHD